MTSASVGGSAGRHRPVPESRRVRDSDVPIRILHHQGRFRCHDLAAQLVQVGATVRVGLVLADRPLIDHLHRRIAPLADAVARPVENPVRQFLDPAQRRIQPDIARVHRLHGVDLVHLLRLDRLVHDALEHEPAESQQRGDEGPAERGQQVEREHHRYGPHDGQGVRQDLVPQNEQPIVGAELAAGQQREVGQAAGGEEVGEGEERQRGRGPVRQHAGRAGQREREREDAVRSAQDHDLAAGVHPCGPQVSAQPPVVGDDRSQRDAQQRRGRPRDERARQGRDAHLRRIGVLAEAELEGPQRQRGQHDNQDGRPHGNPRVVPDELDDQDGAAGSHHRPAGA